MTNDHWASVHFAVVILLAVALAAILAAFAGGVAVRVFRWAARKAGLDIPG